VIYDLTRSQSHRHGRVPGLHWRGATCRRPDRDGRADRFNRQSCGCPAGRPDHVRGPTWRNRFRFAGGSNRRTTGRADYRLGRPWRGNHGARLSDRLDRRARPSATAAAATSARAATGGCGLTGRLSALQAAIWQGNLRFRDFLSTIEKVTYPAGGLRGIAVICG